MNKHFLAALRRRYALQHVLIVGLGSRENGSGAAAVKFFLRVGARVRVEDLKTASELKPVVAALSRFATKYSAGRRLELKLGGHSAASVGWADLVVQNPGVPDNLPLLQAARTKGKEITNDIRLFFDLTHNPILAVTGTRGKSTTTALLHAAVRRKFPRTRLGGNIGVSPLEFIFSLRPEDPVVLELSSWLLHHLAGARRAPQIAVITNILLDHVNRYGSQKDYIADKENIFTHQTLNDWTIFNRANSATRILGKRTPAKRAWFQIKPLGEENGAFIRRGKIVIRLNGKEEALGLVSKLSLLGRHNQENILAAALAARCFNIPAKTIFAALCKFHGLSYRLENLGKKYGVTWWNDSAATTPDATIAALKTFTISIPPRGLAVKRHRQTRLVVRRQNSLPAFHHSTPSRERLGEGALRKVILICGGESKGVPMKPLNPYLKKVKQALIVPGRGSEELSGGERVGGLAEAVERACVLAASGDHILFSPGTTWLPKIDEFKRGDLFRELVKYQI